MAKINMITILIIDGNTTQANYFASILEKENYKIQIAKTSEETSNLLENGNLSMVFLNSKMPDNSSIAILNMIRKKFSQNELPVLSIIEIANTQIEEQFLESGTNSIVNLPITDVSLKLRIRNLLQIRENAIHLEQQIKQQRNIFENSPVPSLLLTKQELLKILIKRHTNFLKLNKEYISMYIAAKYLTVITLYII